MLATYLRIASPVCAALAVTAPAVSQFGAPQQIDDVVDVRRTVPADVDGDGDLDLLVAAEPPSGGRVDWYEALGGGAFAAARPVAANLQGVAPVTPADLDGDGDVDVLLGLRDAHSVVWAESLGSGVFGALRTIDAQVDDPRDVIAIDFDGDGDSDVVVADHASERILSYENLGGGTFGPRRVLRSGVRYVRALDAGDLDGDGDLDVVAAGQDVAWYENTGAALSWPEHVIDDIYLAPVDVHLADLDGDGELDLLAAYFTLGQIYRFLNQGGGAFGPPGSAGTNGRFASSVGTADFDGDGDLDTLATASELRSVVWARNGGGSFGSAITITSALRGPHAIALDVDGDGAVDIVTASTLDGQVAWRQNRIPWFTRECGPAVPNSSGFSAVIGVRGPGTLQQNGMQLTVAFLPAGTFGYYLASRQAGLVANPGGSQGNLCLGGAIGRFVAPGQVLDQSTNFSFLFSPDLTAIPTPTGLVQAQPGETWRFQCWFRDSVGGVGTSNFSDVIAVRMR